MAYTITINNETSVEAFSDKSSVESGSGESVNIYVKDISGLDITDNDQDILNAFTQISSIGFSQVANSCTESSSYVLQAVGKTAENPYTGTSSWWKSGGASADYSFNFSSIPVGANIMGVTVKVYGARESSTTDNTHMAKITLLSGNTQKGSPQEFTSTSNQIITINNPGTWTRAELQNAKLRFTVNYYGGHVGGITWTVTYEWHGYKYVISSIESNRVIHIEIGKTYTLYFRQGQVWKKTAHVFCKSQGTWTEIKFKDVPDLISKCVYKL